MFVSSVCLSFIAKIIYSSEQYQDKTASKWTVDHRQLKLSGLCSENPVAPHRHCVCNRLCVVQGLVQQMALQLMEFDCPLPTHSKNIWRKKTLVKIYTFNVINSKCCCIFFLLFLHIFCGMLRFYSPTFLWFQKDSVKFIER